MPVLSLWERNCCPVFWQPTSLEALKTSNLWNVLDIFYFIAKVAVPSTATAVVSLLYAQCHYWCVSQYWTDLAHSISRFDGEGIEGPYSQTNFILASSFPYRFYAFIALNEQSRLVFMSQPWYLLPCYHFRGLIMHVERTETWNGR